MTEEQHERYIAINDNRLISELFGRLDENLNTIEREMDIEVFLKEGRIVVVGDKDSAKSGELLIGKLLEIIESHEKLTEQKLNYTIKSVLEGRAEEMKEFLNDVVCITDSGKRIKPMTMGQKKYVDSIRAKDLVFSIGPAGTGKTYLAMAMAINAFKNKEVKKIILTRPAVEAGENLGFLPGDLQEKVDPYLRPLYDALFDILGYEAYGKLVEKDLIEIAPLAYMRGRTLDSAYVILDEAQNTTNEQMKMFLTRLGFGSKAIITGDITQIDLPKGQSSGLVTASKVLKNVKEIDFVYLKTLDVVRHPLVQKVIEAYEDYEKENR